MFHKNRNFRLIDMGESRFSMAVQRTGDLFSSTYDLYLGMVILHKKSFINRVQALHQSTLAVPSSDGTHRVICERTRLILEAHTYGLTFLTLNRARMSWKDENFIVDLEIRETGKFVSG